MRMLELTAQQLRQAGVIAIIRSTSDAGGGGGGGDLLSAARALARGGVRAVEVTLNTPGALDAIRRIAAHAEPQQLVIGAGTILSADDAAAAIDAGARFIVTPTLQPDSIALCRRRGAPICCGCMSLSEIVAATRLGSDFVKVFPATSLGLPAIEQMLAEMPELQLVPTGGVSASNLGAFIRAGCAAVAVGSALVDRALLAKQDWTELERRARMLADALEEARR